MMIKSIFDSPNLLLHGGGFDSTLVAIHLQDSGVPFSILHVDYGHLAAEAELYAVKEQVVYLNILRQELGQPPIQLASLTIDLPVDKSNSLLFTGNLEHSPVIPNRNGKLIALAKRFNPEVIYIGAAPVEDISAKMDDCTRGYMNKLEDALDIKIETPFLHMTGFEYLKLIIEKQIQSWSMLSRLSSGTMNLVMTCWNPYKFNGVWTHCGKCKHCLKRRDLLDAAAKDVSRTVYLEF